MSTLSACSRPVVAVAVLFGVVCYFGCGSSATQGGVSPPRVHSVSLVWNASSSDVVGYNVYRSSQAGGPYSKISIQVLSSTGFTDTSVRAGSTYFYAVTAVGTNAAESGFSNEAEATVPSP